MQIGDRIVDAVLAGCGIAHLFEEWLRPHLQRGILEPVLESWWSNASAGIREHSGSATARQLV